MPEIKKGDLEKPKATPSKRIRKAKGSTGGKVGHYPTDSGAH